MNSFRRLKVYKKILVLTGIYLIFFFLAAIIGIGALNNSIKVHEDVKTPVVPLTTPTNLGDPLILNKNTPGISFTTGKSYAENIIESGETIQPEYMPGKKFSDVPLNAQNISFSYDGKYCVYLFQGKIFIKEITSDTTIKTISENQPVTYLVLMNDRNIIIYFTLNETSLNLSTFNIDSMVQTLQKTIEITPGTIIKQADYSNLLSQVLVNLETRDGDRVESSILRINLMKIIYPLGISIPINKMVMLNNAYSLYFEDQDHILHTFPEALSGFSDKKVHLVGSDDKDNIFAQSLDNKNTIYVLKEGKASRTIELTDPSFLEIYSNKLGVYVIYGKYLVNIAKDLNKKMVLDKYLIFSGVGGKNIFFRDSDNNIISLESNL